MIKKLLQRLFPGDRFVQAVLTLLSGTTSALIIAYLAQPILTRLYLPVEFGLFDTFLAIVSILIPFASLRYEDALMLPEKDEEALHIFGLSSFLVIVFTIAITVLVATHGSLIAQWIGSPELEGWLYWIPLVLIAMRFSKLSELWLSRKKLFKTISSGQVAQASVISGGRIGLSNMGTVGLFVGYLAGQLSTALMYGVAMFRQEGRKLLSTIDTGGMRKALSRFRQFPIYSMPATLLSALITRLPFLVLIYFFNEEIVGFFGRAFGLFAIPLSLIGNAISQVFFVEGMEAQREKKLPHLLRLTYSQLIVIGFFPTVAVMIVGPELFGFLLGAQWYVSGEYLQYIAPWLFLAGIASPLTRTFDILERQRLDLLTSLGMFIIQTAALIAGGLSGNIWTCLLYVCIGGSVARFIQLVIILKMGKVTAVASITDVGKHVLQTLPFVGLVLLLHALGSPLWIFIGFTLLAIGNLILGFRTIGRNAT